MSSFLKPTEESTYAVSRDVDRKVALQVSHWMFIAFSFCYLIRVSPLKTSRGQGRADGLELRFGCPSSVFSIALALLRGFGSLCGHSHQLIVVGASGCPSSL